MSVRTTIDLPDDIYAALHQRAKEERTSIRALITSAIDTSFGPRQIQIQSPGPLVGKRRKQPAPGSPDRENPYDVPLLPDLECLAGA